MNGLTKSGETSFMYVLLVVENELTPAVKKKKNF